MHARALPGPGRHHGDACRAGAAGSSRSARRPCGRSRRRPPPGELEGDSDLYIRGDYRFAAGRRPAHQLPPAPLVAAAPARGLLRPPVAGAVRRGAGRGVPVPVLRRRHARRPQIGTAAAVRAARGRPSAIDRGRADGPARTGVVAHGAGQLRHARASCRSAPAGAVRTLRRRGPRASSGAAGRARPTPTTSCSVPGAETVAALGGLHRFTGWDGHLLTDSGGFQVFSLDPEVDDDGVTFRSTYDGSPHRLTPERAVAVQEQPRRRHPDGPRRLPARCRRRRRGAAPGRRAHPRLGGPGPARPTDRADQALFGIVQGGADADLRAESAARTAELGLRRLRHRRAVGRRAARRRCCRPWPPPSPSCRPTGPAT